jgi:endonuclease-3 related protein
MQKARERLRDLYSALRGHFGYHPKWWPGSPLEIALTTILVQQCDWSAAWNAVQRLRASGLLALPALAEADRRRVLGAIRGVAFSPTKSGRLIQFAQILVQWGFRDVEGFLRPAETSQLRLQLLSVNGIGEETADCILLFAGQHPCFVVDAYTRRLFSRLKLFAGVPDGFWSSSYGALKAFFESHILADMPSYSTFALDSGVSREVALFRDFHAQIVEMGKHHCLKRNPLCRAIGKQGWRDYEICRTHCGNSGECAGCPAARMCGGVMRNA